MVHLCNKCPAFWGKNPGKWSAAGGTEQKHPLCRGRWKLGTREKLSHTGCGLIACAVALCLSTSEPQMGAPAFFFFFPPKAMLKGRPGWLGAGCLVLQVKEGPSASGRGRPARRAYCLLSIRSTLIRTPAFQTDGPASFPERSARRGRWKSFHGFKWDFSQALEWKELDLGEGLHFCTSPLLPCASPGSGGCIPSPRWSMWHQAPELGAEPSPPPGAISRSW